MHRLLRSRSATSLYSQASSSAAAGLPRCSQRKLHAESNGQPAAGTSQLMALANLIVEATKTVEAHYSRTKQPHVPSLDDTSEHPLDAGPSDRELRKAIQTIEGACAQLAATVARPSHTVVNKYMSFFEPACLQIVLNFKIADILEKKPNGMHIIEISEKSGVDARKLGRVLRLLATKHVFREVSENVFANNRLSIQLLSRNHLSSLGRVFTSLLYGSAGVLSDTLADPEWGHSYAATHSAFNKYSGFPEPLFAYFEGGTPKGAELGAHFGLGMIGWGFATEACAVIKEYPWADLGPDASVCDVGGGVGNITLQLAKAYPNLKLKLQDLPECIQQAKEEVWPQKCPEAITEGRIEFKAINLFDEPPIPGCTAYYLKNVIHAWPDAESIKILANIKKAMSPDSRVLIHEYILQDAFRVPDEEAKFPQAPEPLLPNYGAGRIRQYNLDMNMMTVLNSQQRHLDHFIKLGEAAGLRFEKVWELGEAGMVEFRLP